VAFGLARLGRDVDFLTQLGTDAHGALMRGHLESAGVLLSTSSDHAERTPSARALLDESGAAHYELDVEWRLDLATATTPGAHLHLGSFPAFLGGTPADVEALLLKARATSTTSFDPNIRPALMPAQHLVRDRLEALLPWIDVIKASDEDVAWLYPDLDPVDVIARWLTLGPSLAIVTLGREGSLAAASAGLIRVPAQRVEVVDTVGAGDSYMSALLDGLAGADLLGNDRRENLQSASVPLVRAVLERAARAAGITVTRAGANPPDRVELLINAVAESCRPDSTSEGK